MPHSLPTFSPVLPGIHNCITLHFGPYLRTQ